MRHSVLGFSSLLLLLACNPRETVPSITSAALCANPSAYEGREIEVAVELDATHLRLVWSTNDACSEDEPCCNVAGYEYLVPDCGETIALTSERGLVECRGKSGDTPECADCSLGSAWDVRSVRGVLSPRLDGVRTFEVLEAERETVTRGSDSGVTVEIAD